MYIASDSRISWGTVDTWDRGRKTFASSSSPHIFGYWGDVLFPSLALPTVLDEIAAGTMRSRGSAFGDIVNSLRRLWDGYPQREQRDFGIILGTRRRDGMDSVFELAVITFEAENGTWELREVPMPCASARLHLAGSGSRYVREAETVWQDSAQGGTSRAIYSAFVEALSQGADPYSGGAPQLVGLYRKGPGVRFGTVYQGKRYIAGNRVTQRRARISNVQWFNELFERADGGRAKRLPQAQKHALP